jgi:hypothetical protein
VTTAIAYPRRTGTLLNADIDTSEEVAVIDTVGYGVLAVSFLVGVADLSAFIIQGRVHPSGGWFNLAAAGADFTSPNDPILGASGDITTAADGATVHWFKMDVLGLDAVRFMVAGTSSTITGHYGLL